jgi:hypothetical protein
VRILVLQFAGAAQSTYQDEKERAAFYGLIFVLSLYVQQIHGWSPLTTGLAFLPMMAAVLPVNLVAPSASAVARLSWPAR